MNDEAMQSVRGSLWMNLVMHVNYCAGKAHQGRLLGFGSVRTQISKQSFAHQQCFLFISITSEINYSS